MTSAVMETVVIGGDFAGTLVRQRLGVARQLRRIALHVRVLSGRDATTSPRRSSRRWRGRCATRRRPTRASSHTEYESVL